MPIRVNIPMEIDDYQKKIIWGLTLRQLICLPLAILLGAVIFFAGTRLGLTIDAASWLVILGVLPVGAVGFVRPNDEPFETWLQLRLRHYLAPSRLLYTADVTWAKSEQKGVAGDALTFIPKKQPRGSELQQQFVPGRSKGKRKQTKKRIKAARKEYREAIKAARAADASVRRAA